MKIGVLGTGGMAAALSQGWSSAGYSVDVAGRSEEAARRIARDLGDGVRAATPAAVARDSDIVVIAVAWEGISTILQLADAPQGSLRGTTVIDCTNAVDYTTFELKPSTGSTAEQVAELAPGAHVVKALHLFAGRSWLTPATPDQPPRTVAMCGDHLPALESTAELVRALGAVPATIGPLKAARQLEETAGYVMRLVAAGVDPITAVPHVPAPGSSRQAS